MNKIHLKKHLFCLIAAYLPIALLFFLLPELDIKLSQLFYNLQDGFFLERYKLAKLFNHASRGITGLVLLLCMFCVIKKFWQTKSIKFSNYRNVAFVMIVFLIGPVLIVQFSLKSYSHRPRPYDVVQFSGTQQFVEFAKIGRMGECVKNCSFTSGHAAVGYACICFAFLPFLRRHCFKLKVAGWIFGTLLGFSRVMSGYHFLSDILFSGFFVYLVILATFFVIYREE